jgi:uncharacterized membrane protein YsdA (DUF1294 family)
MPGWLVAWLVVINIVTGGAYAWDKAQSKRTGARRVRERTLWILCVAGGVIGAWIAFFGLRHKTRHSSFWTVQVLASVLWIAIVLWILLG